MDDDLFFVMIAQIGHPDGEGWRVETVELDREAAEARAEIASRAVTWIDGEDYTERLATMTKVLSREELVEVVGPQRAAEIEEALAMQIRMKRGRAG